MKPYNPSTPSDRPARARLWGAIWLACFMFSGCELFADYESVELAQSDAGASDARDSADTNDSTDAGDTVDTTDANDVDLDASDASDSSDSSDTDTGADAAPRPISLDIDFSGGSLDVAGTTVSDTTVRLAGRQSFYAGEWKWFYFRARNVRGKQPEFSIATNFVGDTSVLAGHQMVYSADGESWEFFDNNSLDEQAGEFRFSNNRPFEADPVFIAFGIPYTAEDAGELVAELRQSQWASPTSSANADLIIGRSPGGSDDLDRVIPVHDIYGFVITDPSAVNAKKKVVLTGGIHANEPTGNHVLEGLVRWLVGDSSRAVALRKEAAFFVYPLVNPDGYAAGYDRSTVAKPGTDPNRVFAPNLWNSHAEVKLVGNAILADTGGDIDYLLDFHVAVGSGRRYAYLDVDGDPTGIQMADDVFWTNLSQTTFIDARDAALGHATAMKFAFQSADANFVATFEPYYEPGWDKAAYHAFGEQLGRAFAP